MAGQNRQIDKARRPRDGPPRGRQWGRGTHRFVTSIPVRNIPGARGARFGQTGYGIIGGGHKIARFPSPVNGAAPKLRSAVAQICRQADRQGFEDSGPAITASACPATIRMAS